MGRARCAAFLLIFLAAACGDNLDAGASDGNNNGGNGDAADSDGAMVIDAGDEVDAAVGVACGGETCGSGMECCVQGQNRSCVATGSCNGVNFDCDGLEDCAGSGMVCCFSAGGGAGGGSTCTAAMDCPTPTCAGPADCPTAQNMCCTVGQLQVCLAQCPP